MQNDPMEPIIEKYRQELLAFSRKYPKYTPQPDTEPEPEPEPEPEDPPEPEPERILPAGQLVRADFAQDAAPAVMNMDDRRRNVAQREENAQKAQPPQDNAAEQEFIEQAEAFPPYLNGSIEQFPSEADFLRLNPESGFLRVQVFAANQAFPIPNATVVVSKRFPAEDCVFFKSQTDASGIMSRITLPAPDRLLADAPSAMQPYATYDIVVTHPLFTEVHLADVAVFDSVETVQNVEMIPCRPDVDPAMLTGGEG
ncbi:MAG: hypothetical protein IKW76_03500 [Clostridia bacterium]|nr:hypothetical protein [Clostridia bacterium]